MADPVVVSLTHDEALVLYDWIHRMEDEKRVEALTAHKGETVALWNLSALLERELVEPFQANYGSLVDDARARLGTS
jgi:hypothetical protein